LSPMLRFPTSSSTSHDIKFQKSKKTTVRRDEAGDGGEGRMREGSLSLLSLTYKD
jgi:hypothetical protein